MNKHLISLRRLLSWASLGACVLTCSTSFAAPAQVPLLTRGTMVAPNIVYMFDDSGSMDATYLFQEANPAAWGYTSVSSLNLSSGMGIQPNNDDYARCSPQINQLYYDPTTRYDPPFNNAGVRLAPATRLSSTTVSTGTDVCITTTGQPDVFLYNGGPGPNWDGTKKLNVAASYTKTTIKSTTTSYPKATGRTDCAGTTCTYAEEAQNFANWNKWYQTRILMARNASIEAFVNLPSTFRLGWALLNTVDTGSLTEGVSDFTMAKRSKFIDFLNALGTSGSTPSRMALDRVGKYFMRRDTDGPWGNTPPGGNTTAAVQVGEIATKVPSNPNTTLASCRRSNALYLTDGYYNDSFSPSTAYNFDNVTSPAIPNPYGASYTYNPVLPYKQSRSNTFADVAMKYWVTDLYPGLDNKVAKVPGVDDAFWQHLNFWAIGLGVVGTMTPSDATLTEIKNGTKSWPTPSTNQPSALDDMWHATVNARGGFLNAANSTQLVTSLNSMIGQILKASASQAGVAVSTVNLNTGTMKFVPAYTTGEWTGNIIANNLDINTGNETNIAWMAETRDNITGLETANTLCPTPGNATLCPATLPDLTNYAKRATSRNILVGNGATTGARAVPFTYTDMNAVTGLVASITPAYTGQIIDNLLINYLRGDRAQEGTNGTRIYRTRPTVLGDVVNSTPTFIKPALDYGYGSSATAPAGYAAYLGTKAARTEGTIFFGANDGMAHALAENDGREVFAYVPKAVLPTVAKLAANDYNTNHLYYVDGPFSQGDFYNGTSWRNAVVGTTGAGAKAVFAFDATTPTSMSAANVLWEVSSSTANFSELGFVLNDVQIGLMRNGQWAAIFGNGYSSASGKAQLFIVNMNDGTLIKKIDTLAGPNNGLSGVRLVTNKDSEVIGAYAGDLLGNMWKFDLFDTNAANWGVGFGTTAAPKPLYQAKASTGTAQPITAMPYVLPHPAGGYLVALSTGKLFEDADLVTTGTQTAYGIYDKTAFGTTPLPNPAVSQVAGTSSLVQQTVSTDISIPITVTAFDNTTSTQNVTYYTVSANPINWTTQNGWYFNLPNAGQRTVFPVDALASRLIRVDTLQPGGVSSDPCSSATSATGINYIIDALTGGSPLGPILDTNGDGVVGAGDDTTASAYTTSADGRDVVISRATPVAATDLATAAAQALAAATRANYAATLTTDTAIRTKILAAATAATQAATLANSLATGCASSFSATCQNALDVANAAMRVAELVASYGITLGTSTTGDAAILTDLVKAIGDSLAAALLGDWSTATNKAAVASSIANPLTVAMVQSYTLSSGGETRITQINKCAQKLAESDSEKQACCALSASNPAYASFCPPSPASVSVQRTWRQLFMR